MNRISEDMLNAMHILAAAIDEEKVENGNTSISVDYDNEKIIYKNHKAGWKFTANCAMDSERGAVKDFCKQIILHERW